MRHAAAVITGNRGGAVASSVGAGSIMVGRIPVSAIGLYRPLAGTRARVTIAIDIFDKTTPC